MLSWKRFPESVAGEGRRKSPGESEDGRRENGEGEDKENRERE